MSTRSNIKIVDNCGSILLYKHHDGYPEGNIPFIRKFLKNNMESAEFMANEMIKQSECEASSGIHGDIEYYYEVDARTGDIATYEVGFASEDMERIFPQIPEEEATI